MTCSLAAKAKRMLEWPLETVTEQRAERDGQLVTIRTIAPTWCCAGIAKFLVALDKMGRASVEDLTKAEAEHKEGQGEVVERTFRLFRSEEVQLPKLPEAAIKSEPQPQDDWTVDYGGQGVPKPQEQGIPW